MNGQDQGSRVVAISAQGPDDPAFRIRLAQPARALATRGMACSLVPLFSAEETLRFRLAGPLGKAVILRAARRRVRDELDALSDFGRTVVVQRFADLNPSLAVERAAVRRKRLVYDVDDAVWLTGSQTMGDPMGFLKGSSRKVRWLVERADQIVAGNDLIAEYLTRRNEAVTVVPPLVDCQVYALRAHEQGPVLTLGWIGSSTTARYLTRLVHVLEQFAAESRRSVRVLVVGGKAPQIDGVEVCERSWSPTAELQALAEMDIGLMPLDNTPWSRGKCAYKALQYMASGIPTIADDVGVSAHVVAQAGYVANDAGGWLEGLRELSRDVRLRSRLGRVGRSRIEVNYSLERWLPTLEKIWRGS
jgi:glycosyltransferase involved in cell wall biosynthesis